MVYNKHGFRARLHTCTLSSNVAESDNSSEDELPFDESIPLAGYKEQDEDRRRRGSDRRFSQKK